MFIILSKTSSKSNLPSPYFHTKTWEPLQQHFFPPNSHNSFWLSTLIENEVPAIHLGWTRLQETAFSQIKSKQHHGKQEINDLVTFSWTWSLLGEDTSKIWNSLMRLWKPNLIITPEVKLHRDSDSQQWWHPWKKSSWTTDFASVYTGAPS